MLINMLWIGFKKIRTALLSKLMKRPDILTFFLLKNVSLWRIRDFCFWELMSYSAAETYVLLGYKTEIHAYGCNFRTEIRTKHKSDIRAKQISVTIGHQKFQIYLWPGIEIKSQPFCSLDWSPRFWRTSALVSPNAGLEHLHYVEFQLSR